MKLQVFVNYEYSYAILISRYIAIICKCIYVVTM